MMVLPATRSQTPILAYFLHKYDPQDPRLQLFLVVAHGLRAVGKETALITRRNDRMH